MSIRTLVIHPRDSSTRFLKRVYSRLDATVIERAIPQYRLRRLMDGFDQIMMLGHGSPSGLMSVGQFPGCWDVIDSSFVPQLAERDNSVFIWCNADRFVQRHNLRGFYTGMFISEMSEARLFRLPWYTTQSDVRESNELFADVVGRFAPHGLRLVNAAVKHEYGKLALNNPVARYNAERIYLKEGGNHDHEAGGLRSPGVRIVNSFRVRGGELPRVTDAVAFPATDADRDDAQGADEGRAQSPAGPWGAAPATSAGIAAAHGHGLRGVRVPGASGC